MTDRKLLEQEPVAWMYTNAKGRSVIVETNISPFEDAIPLYIAPPKREWQGLTDEEISAISKSIPGETVLWAAKFFFARAIEAKLRGKND
jgi:uncharacterized UPF0160 family protein